MTAIITTHNGNVYKSNELVAVTEREGYYLLISKYDPNDLPVAEMVINRNNVKTIRTIGGKINEQARDIQSPVKPSIGTSKKVRMGFRG